jgi:glucosyl-3-phosphoglycerate synthase
MSSTLRRAVQRALAWNRSRTHHHREFPADRVAAEKELTVSVLLPARNEAATIGPILAELMPLRDRGVLDQVVVLDDSHDGTGDIAASLGAEVHDQSQLRPEFGPVSGKGDAMWRGLAVAHGDVVCYLDADSRDFGAHFALGLLGPIVCGAGDVQFVKGFYRRPLELGATRLPDGGGRVTELTARPLLNRFFAELAGVRQPLAGEIAARRDLLERLPFACGYAVDVGLLIDAWREVGLDGLAQVDLDVRQNRHQPLRDLGPMAAAVLAAVVHRLERDGRLAASEDQGFLAPGADGGFAERGTSFVERPPAARLHRLGASTGSEIVGAATSD